MAGRDAQSENKDLHQLLEEEFQQLVDIIEQKKILHEGITLDGTDDSSPVVEGSRRLRERSAAMGAETLAEYFNALETSARDGDSRHARELLQDISAEFESVRKILDDD